MRAYIPILLFLSSLITLVEAQQKQPQQKVVMPTATVPQRPGVPAPTAPKPPTGPFFSWSAKRGITKGQLTSQYAVKLEQPGGIRAKGWIKS